jgi:3-hydroxybutyryl-CoA dehydrogenase
MKNISVIGSGQMGKGIAQLFSSKGFEVTLINPKEKSINAAEESINSTVATSLKKGRITEEEAKTIKENLSFDTTYESIRVADLVIEAIPEVFRKKMDLFLLIEDYAQINCIFATNTSSFSIDALAHRTNHRSRFIGMHFFNPVSSMKLVEIVLGEATSIETAVEITHLCTQLDKTPVYVKNSPGFIVNRLLIPMLNEAIDILHTGVAGVNEIDTAMKLGCAHPMGPLQLADYIGLDVCLSIMNELQEGLDDNKYESSILLKLMVLQGNLGMKSGKGFYSYENGRSVGVAELVI